MDFNNKRKRSMESFSTAAAAFSVVCKELSIQPDKVDAMKIFDMVYNNQKQQEEQETELQSQSQFSSIESFNSNSSSSNCGGGDTAGDDNVTIYALNLENHKYYVGRTSDVDARIDQHRNGTGCSWTVQHPFSSVLFIRKHCDNFDEDKITLQLMDQYGIDNVRGGMWCHKVLTDDDRAHIVKCIRSSRNLCFTCGSSSHQAKDCRPSESKYTGPPCARCFRRSHSASQCFANTTKTGQPLTA